MKPVNVLPARNIVGLFGKDQTRGGSKLQHGIRKKFEAAAGKS